MLVLEKKKQLIKSKIIEECSCDRGCDKCSKKIQFIDKMADAAIPCAYWELPFSKFSGSKNVKDAVIDYVKDLKQNYMDGACIAFSGTMGTGKTYSMNTILKSAISQGYSAYYTTMPDMMMYLTDPEHKRLFNKVTSTVDFLGIDEVDSRHFGNSGSAEEFAGRTFEKIIRHRIQNELPMIIATNEAKLEDAFTGEFKKVVQSLRGINTKVVPALGKDYRLSRR